MHNVPNSSPATGLSMPRQTLSEYDAVPYPGKAMRQTHPGRLAAVALLSGLTPPPPGRCRVLELGCAAGGNLIPMALTSPQSEFVGIDLSARQVSDGQGVIRELGLTNISLRHLSVLDVDPRLGKFDYLIAHGLYSWVPPAVQDRILALCASHLTPQGIAYISYNTYPGWHRRQMVRHMMRYQTSGISDPMERVRKARATLDFVTRGAEFCDPEFGRLLRAELETLSRFPDFYLLHEHLTDYNEPLYFEQFIARIKAKGLQYVGEAQFSGASPGTLSPQLQAELAARAADVIAAEQYMDFFKNNSFRQSVLCGAAHKLDHVLRPQRLRGLYVSSPAKPKLPAVSLTSEEPQDFVVEKGPTLTTRDPLLKSAMTCLADIWPRSLGLEELWGWARQRASTAAAASTSDPIELARKLLPCYPSTLIELMACPDAFTDEIGPRPLASPYARLAARTEMSVANLRHQMVDLNESAQQVLLCLDGKHDRDAIAAAMWRWAGEHRINLPQSPQFLQGAIDEMLGGMAKAALLCSQKHD